MAEKALAAGCERSINLDCNRQACADSRRSLDTILPMHHREGSTVENWKNLHLVVLLQAPQKIHPAFDEVLAAVTRADTRVRVAILGSLRKKSSNETREEDVDVPKDNGLDDKEQNDTPLIALQRRLAAAGVVEGALLFLDNFLPHEDLLGLFRTARVALDPLYFGGDGTSREALEMRCPVVTLPTGALGSRWTASLYQLLGLADGDVAKEGDYRTTKFEVKPNLAPIAKNIDGMYSWYGICVWGNDKTPPWWKRCAT